MQKNLLLLCTTLTVFTLFTGCGQLLPALSTDTDEACVTLNKKILKVDNFTKMLNETSAFHLEESASSLETPGITVSNNKRQMLRDAKKRKARLHSEYQTLGCKTAE